MARCKLCASITFEILPLSTCTLCQQKSYLSKGAPPNFEIFPSAQWCWGWVFVWKVSGAQVFYFCSWQRENFAHRQHFKFCHYQPVLCASKNPISPKVFTRFSKSLRQVEDVDGGHLGGKFQVRRHFSFAMVTWNFCASTTFEILLLSTCTLCQQKSDISKGIQQIFEIFAWAGRCWGWAFGWKGSGAQVLCFSKGKVKTLRIDNIWNFATFYLYTAPAKILYLQRYSDDFRNLCLSSKMLKVVIWVETFRCGDTVLLQWHVENFSHRPQLKFCHCQYVHCASKSPISPMIFSRFSKSLPQLEDVEGGDLGGKFQLRKYFAFAMAWWKLCASTTFEILPLSICTLCQQKSYISKDIQPIFEIFASARRCWWWQFGWKVSYADVFYFSNCKVKTLRIHNIWNFVTFNLYTVPAKILYLQWYSTDFRNLFLSSKILRAGICVESFVCARILLLQWQGENVAHQQHLKFCYFQHVHCASKNPVSPMVFNRFSKSVPLFEDVEGAHLGGKFHIRKYFTFAMAWWKLSASTIFEIFPLSTCTLCLQNPISPKVFNQFSKSLPQLEDIEAGHLSGKFHTRRYFNFAMATWKLWASTTFEILLLSSCTLRQKKSYISRRIQPIFEIFVSAWRCWGRKFACKVSAAKKYFTFAMAWWKLSGSTIFEIFALSTCTLCQEKSNISKDIQPILEILASARRYWAWAFGWKVSCSQVFYFCNGKLKTLRSHNIWNFATFNM